MKNMRKRCGAQNISNFRNRIERGLLPKEDSISYEGVFNTYYFNTGVKETKDLVKANYFVANCEDIIKKKREKYICLALNSSEDGKNYRAPLNLIVVLDISGSMGSGFNESNSSESTSTRRKTKMDVAKEVLIDLIKTMKDDEYLGIILFDDRVQIFQPLRKVSLIDKDSLIERAEEINDRGSTDMEKGMSTALEMINDNLKEKPEISKNNSRIIFLTDACPNTGGGKDSLLGLSKTGAKTNIFTTFIGIGLDFNSSLVEQISKVRGCNYFSVKNRKEFNKILVEDFNYIVTPICHNCILFVESPGYQIDKVYGTTFSKETTNICMRIETLSASAIDEKLGVKGGVFLIKLKEKVTSDLNPSQEIKLTLRYQLPKSEKKIQFQETFDFGKRIDEVFKQEKIFENNCIRKAILLKKFVSICKKTIKKGKVDSEMKEKLKTFKKFFQNEVEQLGDKNLLKEIDVIDRFIYMK